MKAHHDCARRGATVYQYDAVSKLLGYSYPNGVVTSHTFDALDRVLEVRQAKNNATLGGVAYRNSPSGQRLGIDDLIGGTQRTYTYDNLYRLQNETIANDPTHAGAIGYLYDRVGNRLQRQSSVANINPQTFGYDANDQISISGFDDNGNTIDSTGDLPGEFYTDDYDFEDRLIRRTSNLRGLIAEFTYDGDGHRISETTNGQTTEFLVDTQNPTGYAQVLEEHKSGTLATSYAYAHDLIAQHDQTTTGTLTHYFGYDALGTTRLLTDANGNVSDRFWYDAFGTLLKREGTTQTRYLYTGEQYSAAVGLYYMRSRWYSSSIGAFSTPDKWPQVRWQPRTSQFVYVDQNPIFYKDPNGTYKLSDLTFTQVVIGTLFSAVVGIAGSYLLQAPCPPSDTLEGCVCHCERITRGALIGSLMFIAGGTIIPVLQGGLVEGATVKTIDWIVYLTLGATVEVNILFVSFGLTQAICMELMDPEQTLPRFDYR